MYLAARSQLFILSFSDFELDVNVLLQRILHRILEALELPRSSINHHELLDTLILGDYRNFALTSYPYQMRYPLSLFLLNKLIIFNFEY